MDSETERRLHEFLDRHTAETSQLRAIKNVVENNSRSLSVLRSDVSELRGTMIAQVTRLDAAERSIEKLDAEVWETAERTGQHQLDATKVIVDEYRNRLAQHEESKRHWIRYVVATIVGVVLLIISSAIGYLAK